MTPLRVVLDARKLGDGGIGVYIANVIAALDKVAGREIELTAIVSPLDAAKLPTIENGLNLRLVADNARKYSLDELWGMPRRIRAVLENSHVFHAPHYTLPYNLGIPSVVTVHDIIHVTRPDSLLHRVVGEFLIGSALRRASAVITVSQASAKEISRHFSVKDVGVVYNALRQEFLEPIDAAKLCFIHPRIEGACNKASRGGFLLFVADNRPHKGFNVLYQAWLSLRQEWPELRLVVVGKGFESLVSKHQRPRDVIADDGAIIQLPTLHAHELRSLYAKSRAVVVTSYEEGFGFIPLEAIASGATVISRRLPCIEEVCGDCPAYFQNDGEVTATLRQVLQMQETVDDPAYDRGKGKAVSERIKMFTLPRFGEALLKTYENVTGLTAGGRLRGDGLTKTIAREAHS